MTVLTAIDWDQWRTDYDQMKFSDQQDFYRRVAEQHPVQASFDVASAHSAFDVIGGANLSVVELGGWDGRLAHSMLTRPDIGVWVNHDLVAVPQVCTDPRYRLHILDSPLWERPCHADVFVACHTIEHIKARELALLIGCLRVRWVYLEAPLALHGRDWDGYPGSHVLEAGWEDVARMLTDRGYRSAGGSQTAQLWGSR